MNQELKVIAAMSVSLVLMDVTGMNFIRLQYALQINYSCFISVMMVFLVHLVHEYVFFVLHTSSYSMFSFKIGSAR